MALKTGKANVQATLNTSRRPPKLRIIFALVSVAALVSAARVAKPIGTVEITLPARVVAIDRDQVEFAGTIQSGNEYSEISIVINDQTQTLPVTASIFHESKLKLQPGENLVCAFLDIDNWDMISVVTPRVFFHFDDGIQGWSLNASSGLPPELVHTKTDEGHGHLTSEYEPVPTSQNRWDVIFLIDASSSMKTGESDWKRYANSILNSLPSKDDKLRVGLYLYREEGFVPKQRLSEWKDRLPDGICDLSGGGDLTENLVPSLLNLLEQLPNQPTSVRRQIIAITDAPSKSDTDVNHDAIAKMANARQIDIHAVIPFSQLPDGKNDDDVVAQNEINMSLTNLAVLCGKRIAEQNNGVCVEFRIPNKIIWRPADLVVFPELKTLAESQAKANNAEFDKQVARIVAKIKDNVQVSPANGHWSWRPPNDCLESLRSAYKENIFVSLSGCDSPRFILTGAGQTLTLDLPTKSDGWNNFKVALNESTPWVSESGQPPNLQTVLNSLTDFEIRSEPSIEPMSLDRFIITQAGEIVSPLTSNAIKKENREVE